jgi:hypothetical protein
VDLWQARGERKYELDDIMLLKVGRHIRPRPHFKLIVGREEGENNFLEGYRKQFVHMYATSHNGPLVLVDGCLDNEDDLLLAARLTARYCKVAPGELATIEVNHVDGTQRQLQVEPLAEPEQKLAWTLQ